MYDIAIIGGGIIGLATARALGERLPGARIAVLEKEMDVAMHQTGHNSGVIHSGIYYLPGSLKARLCVEGARRLIEFCNAHDVRHEPCGKVIVATSEEELPRLEELYRRGMANGVPGLRRISRKELRELEPNAAGITALHSPNTGVVDYREVALAMAAELHERGTEILTGCRILAVRDGGQALRLTTSRGEIESHYAINCAGLFSDTVARLMGASSRIIILPFRGEYYFLRPERNSLINGLIYPVPDPELPFLGVHFTRTIDGRVEAGPNAVLALAREGYTRRHIQPREMAEALRRPGFWRMARRWWRTGIDEYRRSLSKERFAASLQRLVPEVRAEDLVPGGAGVRAQAVAPDGSLVDDFIVEESPRAIHLLNAPSPAATASLAIGDYIAAMATQSFTLR